jgi:hypothetical protein
MSTTENTLPDPVHPLEAALHAAVEAFALKADELGLTGPRVLHVAATARDCDPDTVVLTGHAECEEADAARRGVNLALGVLQTVTEAHGGTVSAFVQPIPGGAPVDPLADLPTDRLN